MAVEQEDKFEATTSFPWERDQNYFVGRKPSIYASTATACLVLIGGVRSSEPLFDKVTLTNTTEYQSGYQDPSGDQSNISLLEVTSLLFPGYIEMDPNAREANAKAVKSFFK